MKRLQALFKRPSFLGFLGFFLLMASWLRVPDIVGSAAYRGLCLCAEVLIPSLFPFFVLSNLFIRRRYHQYVSAVLAPVMQPLFGVDADGAGALVLGSVGGYPIGAATAVALYDEGSLDARQTARLLGFCNNAGPGFIFGVMGAGIFGSVKAGLLLYLVHLLSAVLVGAAAGCWRGESAKRHMRTGFAKEPEEQFSASLVASIRDAASTMLNVCGFLVFFSVMLAFLRTTPVLSIPMALLEKLPGVDSQVANGLLSGMMELSTGASLLNTQAPRSILLPICAFLLGWGGLCVHCQVLSICGDRPIAMGSYFRGKMAQGLLSAAICVILQTSTVMGAVILLTVIVGMAGWTLYSKKKAGKSNASPV